MIINSRAVTVCSYVFLYILLERGTKGRGWAMNGLPPELFDNIRCASLIPHTIDDSPLMMFIHDDLHSPH